MNEESCLLRDDRADGLTTLTLNRPGQFNSLSRETSGSISSVGESASAANTNSRFVSDFEPGSLMLAAIGELTVGAAQGSE